MSSHLVLTIMIIWGAEMHWSPILNWWIPMELFQKGMSIALIEETWKGRGSAYQLVGKIIYKGWKEKRVCQSQPPCSDRGWKSWVKHRSDAPSERPGESKTAAGSFAPCRNSQYQLFLFWYNYFIREEKNATPSPQNKVIKSAVSMTMRQLYTCPIHNNFPRSAWTCVIQSQCFHETKSCYCCILQTIERKSPGISKATDSAETPQFNLWSETADRLQTQFYFRVTKAMNLVLCHLNQCWLMSFKTFKSAKGSSSERKGFTWHRRDKTLLQGDMSQVFSSTEAGME